MLKSFLKAWGLIAGLALSGAAYAVGMGGINVTTSLGQPLQAEINLVSVGKTEKSGLAAHLASPELYKSAGMDYPYTLPKLQFKVETRANGDRYIKLTSTDPVSEPFISMLVELSWDSGRLLREYTFLLDPPGYKAEMPAAASVTPVAPSDASAQTSASMTEINGNAAMRATAPMDGRSGVAARPAVTSTTGARKPAEASNVASGTIKVKRGDTLNKIARATKPDDISLERMLVALYRANADEFDGKNMNRLRTGKILRVPEASDLDEVAQADAVKEIHAQAADWNAYRQKLAAVAAVTPDESPRQAVSGKISATVADKAPPAKETAKEVVKLSKGEAPGDKTAAAGNTKGLQDKLHSMEEESVAKDKAIRESNERIAVLEKNIKEMQHLLELKSQTMAPAKAVADKVEAPVETKASPAATESKPQEKAAPTAPPVVTTSDLPPAKPKAPAPKVVPPPPSPLDDILGEPLYLAGGAVGLLVLAGLGFMLVRRRSGGKAHAVTPQDIGETTGSRIAEPVAPSPETGDFTGTVSAPPAEVKSGEVDPLVEAELFLNFGRDAQAEEILKDALAKDPSNMKVALKLLSIYADRKDAKTFSVVAHQIQNSGAESAWAQAKEMGRKLDPANPTYGGADAEPSAAAVPQGETKSPAEAASGLDFDLGMGEPAAGAETSEVHDVTSSAAEVDFDLGFGEPAATTPAVEHDATVMLKRPPLPEEELPAEPKIDENAALDFDMSALGPAPAAEPEPAATAAPDLDGMDFDITAGNPVAETAVEAKAAAAADISPDKFGFTLDFPVVAEAPKPEVAAQVAASGAEQMGGISLNLDDSDAAPASEGKDARWHDVATKLDLSKAYQEMGDTAGAREILQEVLNEGDEQQRAAAEAMLQQLPPA